MIQVRFCELAWIGPGGRGSRTSPERRALGVKRHAPRLAARQRGILAFVPLTVVGPGRVVVPDEAARAPPGVGRCVLPRSQVPLPFPAYRTPPEGALVLGSGYDQDRILSPKAQAQLFRSL